MTVSATTVSDRLAQFGPAARARMHPYFARAEVPYPPARIVLAGLKHEGELQVYASGPQQALRFVRSYSIQAASGRLGPKLRAGDEQVPEGLYRVELLNPNSRFHVSLRVNYPNAFDRRMAHSDHRSDLGGDIMIHGNRVSIGCLAMGDTAAEDLFTLAADTGLAHIDVILAPLDLRKHAAPTLPNAPHWISDLYDDIRKAMSSLPTPEASGT